MGIGVGVGVTVGVNVGVTVGVIVGVTGVAVGVNVGVTVGVIGGVGVGVWAAIGTGENPITPKTDITNDPKMTRVMNRELGVFPRRPVTANNCTGCNLRC